MCNITTIKTCKLPLIQVQSIYYFLCKITYCIFISHMI
nr:MAG TPA: hypothetical protein [Caudoviricetes sp.]